MPMTSANTTFGISIPLPATQDQAGYDALTFVSVGSVESIGEHGTTFNEVPFTSLSDARVQKYKGSKDNGNIPLTVAYDAGDAGQQELETALASYDNVSVSITYQDGSVEYCLAKVMSRTKNPGSADSIVMSTISLAIDSEIVEVPAT